jgi:hypothetical protein
MKAIVNLKNRRLLAILLAIALALSFGAAFGTTNAFAATSDPNMTSNDPISGSNPGPSNSWFTYLPSVGATQTLHAIPADSNYLPTGFDSPADANGVIWSIVTDGNITSAGFTGQGNNANLYGYGYEAFANVVIKDSTEFGAVCIQAVNPATDAAVDFTIVQNEQASPPTYTSVQKVNLQIFDPSSGTPNHDNVTVNSNDYYETFTRTYPTGVDSIYEAWLNGVIDTDSIQFYYGIGDSVTSITIDSNQYDNGDNIPGTTNPGFWQYRIYRQAGPTFVVVPLSAVVGADSIKLQESDIVMWKFGEYTDTKLFPSETQPI